MKTTEKDALHIVAIVRWLWRTWFWSPVLCCNPRDTAGADGSAAICGATGAGAAHKEESFRCATDL